MTGFIGVNIFFSFSSSLYHIRTYIYIYIHFKRRKRRKARIYTKIDLKCMALRPLAYDKYVCCCRFGYLVCSVEMWEYGLWNEITTGTRGKCWPAERIQIKILIYIPSVTIFVRISKQQRTDGQSVGRSSYGTHSTMNSYRFTENATVEKESEKEQKRSHQAKRADWVSVSVSFQPFLFCARLELFTKNIHICTEPWCWMCLCIGF